MAKVSCDFLILMLKNLSVELRMRFRMSRIFSISFVINAPCFSFCDSLLGHPKLKSQPLTWSSYFFMKSFMPFVEFPKSCRIGLSASCGVFLLSGFVMPVHVRVHPAFLQSRRNAMSFGSSIGARNILECRSRFRIFIYCVLMNRVF